MILILTKIWRRGLSVATASVGKVSSRRPGLLLPSAASSALVILFVVDCSMPYGGHRFI